jgi:hypothetical protein
LRCPPTAFAGRVVPVFVCFILIQLNMTTEEITWDFTMGHEVEARAQQFLRRDFEAMPQCKITAQSTDI